MYNLIIFLPLIGAVLSWILGNRFSSIPTYIVSISCLFLSMIISWIAFYDIAILKNNCKRLFDETSINIANVKNDKYAINLAFDLS